MPPYNGFVGSGTNSGLTPSSSQCSGCNSSDSPHSRTGSPLGYGKMGQHETVNKAAIPIDFCPLIFCPLIFDYFE